MPADRAAGSPAFETVLTGRPRRIDVGRLKIDGKKRAFTVACGIGYDAKVMDATEPELSRLHELDAQGRVSRRSRDNFALFLIEWLGGPRNFSETRGHPRLRMRHGRVPIGESMRDAWLRCMARALDEQGVSGNVRGFLDARFAEVANFLRNAPE